MISQRYRSILALLISFAIMGLGHGLLSSLLGIRATAEGFSVSIIGLMAAGYYTGFIFGTDLCARMIAAVGHIRSFAVFAAVASGTVLMLALIVNPWSWIVLRTVYGVCSAGIYVVIESWLNAFATNKDRGRILSLYMILNYLGIAFGQGFLFLASTQGMVLFMISAMLFTFSLVPLSASRSKQPEDVGFERFGFRRLYKTSPLATAGCFGVGLILGSFWGLAAVYITKLGLPVSNVAAFVVSVLLGGLLLQWPLGLLSDIFNRRLIIAFVCFLACLSSLGMVYLTMQGVYGFSLPFFILAVLFGGTNYSLYSLMLSLMNDFLQPADLVKASGGLLALHALGAVAGPILASATMAFFGPSGLALFTAAIAGVMCLLSLVRMATGPVIPEKTSDKFVPIPRTGIAVVQLDPRGQGD